VLLVCPGSLFLLLLAFVCYPFVGWPCFALAAVVACFRCSAPIVGLFSVLLVGLWVSVFYRCAGVFLLLAGVCSGCSVSLGCNSFSLLMNDRAPVFFKKTMVVSARRRCRDTHAPACPWCRPDNWEPPSRVVVGRDVLLPLDRQKVVVQSRRSKLSQPWNKLMACMSEQCGYHLTSYWLQINHGAEVLTLTLAF
jgi:hypothetical protein